MRAMDKRVTFNVVPDFSQKKAIVEITTFSHVCRSSSRFKECDFAPLTHNDSADQDEEDEIWSQSTEAEQETITISVDANTLNNLLGSFTENSTSMTLGVCSKEFALIYLTQQEGMVMCLMPHCNPNSM